MALRYLVFAFALHLSALALLPAALAHPHKEALRQATGIDHEEAVRRGQEVGIGSVRMAGPDNDVPLVVASFEAFAFDYMAGRAAIKQGGYVRLAMRHVFHWSPPQTNDPSGAGYVSVSGPDGVALEIVAWPERPDGYDLFLQTFPWQHAIDVRVTSGQLEPGDTLRLTYGDRSSGGPGARVQPSEEPAYAFRFYVATDADAPPLPVAEDVLFRIVGGNATGISLVAPSQVAAGEEVRLVLRAEDRFGNLDPGFAGPVSISHGDGAVVWSGEMTAADGGVLDIRVPATGLAKAGRFTAQAGEFSAESNPLRLSSGSREPNLYWGDIHGHTLNSDGRGTVEGFYAYCRDVAALDFCAVTDHGFMITDRFWQEGTRATEAFNESNRFVTLHAYEWSGLTEVGGDHNIYFRSDDPVIFRSRSYYDERNQQAYHSETNRIDFIGDLNETLVRMGPRQVLSIPHFGGRQASPEWHEPRIERLVEIFSEHGRKHEWAYEFLRRGYRLGIIASSDNHTGRPGYGFLLDPLQNGNWSKEGGSALVAVMAPELTRGAIFDALYDRHAYATTGDRIILSVSAGEAIMGDEMDGSVMPPLRISVIGTDAVQAIEVLKDTEIVYTARFNEPVANLIWRDPVVPEPGQTSAYWVRIMQADNEEAVSSPIWWTQRP